MRIDSLTPGNTVLIELNWYGNDWETMEMQFLGIEGEGENRTARFQDLDNEVWTFCRYQDRWAFSTDMKRLRLLDILA